MSLKNHYFLKFRLTLMSLKNHYFLMYHWIPKNLRFH
jgi:hypothetical protein